MQRLLSLSVLGLLLSSCTPAPDPDPAPPDAPPATWTGLTAGALHSCALWRDGTPSCWGADWAQQASPPDGETFTQIDAGDFHTCGVREDTTVRCWGITDGSDLDGGQASMTPIDGGFVKVASGGWHSCGLGEDGVVACWGSNDEGQLDVPAQTFADISASSWVYRGKLSFSGTMSRAARRTLPLRRKM